MRTFAEEGAELGSEGPSPVLRTKGWNIPDELGWGKTCRESSILTTPTPDPFYGSEEISKTNKHNACGNDK